VILRPALSCTGLRAGVRSRVFLAVITLLMTAGLVFDACEVTSRPFIRLDAPRTVRAGDSCNIRLRIRHPDAALQFGSPGIVEPEMPLWILSADTPTALSAHIGTSGIDFSGGDPVTQGLRKGGPSAEWLWTLTPSADQVGERGIQIAIFDSSDPQLPLRMFTITRLITVKPPAKSEDGIGVPSFFREVAVLLTASVVGGTVLVVVTFYLTRLLRRRETETGHSSKLGSHRRR